MAVNFDANLRNIKPIHFLEIKIESLCNDIRGALLQCLSTTQLPEWNVPPLPLTIID